MTTTNQNNMGSEVGRRLVKIIIAVVGLLIIRLVLDNLPMLIQISPSFEAGRGERALMRERTNRFLLRVAALLP